MQLESLKVFCDIVQLRSFSAAAKENAVTQSMASQTVDGLERQFNLKLIDRSQRPWKLTAEGQVFYEGCRDMVERYAQLEARLKNAHSKLSAIVRVASIYSVGLRHMSYYIHQFSQLYPWAHVKIEYLHPDRVYEAVQNDTADLGIVSYPFKKRELTVVIWQQEEMVLACHPQHRLARRREAAVREIAGEKFVALEKDLVIRKETDRYLKQNGVEVDIILEFDNTEVIKRAVEIASGVAILPRPILDKEVKLGTLAAVPLAGKKFVRPLGIIHRKGKTFNPNVLNFIDLLQKQKDVKL
jgi:DNA-binding transcriptional LysR family regulator